MANRAAMEGKGEIAVKSVAHHSKLAASHESLRNREVQTAEQLKAAQNQLAEIREQLGLYSVKLNHQTAKLSETNAQMSELEAQLSCHTEELKELRAQLSGIVDNESTSEALASVPTVADEAFADPCGRASLVAFPDHVPVGGTVGFTEISWDTGDGSEGQVYVSVDGEPETLFATGQRGSKQAPWIVAGQSYEFRLYAGTEHNRLLKEVSVVGTKIPLRESGDVLRGFLDTPAENSSGEPYLDVSGWA